MATPSCFSICSVMEFFLRRKFTAAGLEHKNVEIDDATTLSCWIPKGSSHKPALVLIHGFGPSATWQWASQVRPLAADFDLYVPNLVFFGGSTTSSLERSEVFQAVCVGKMMEKLGVERFSILGTSYGGFVAYNLARLFAERVEKVVIASSAVNMKAGDNERLLKLAGVAHISDLLLPTTPEVIRASMKLTHFRPPAKVPDFLANNIIRVLFSENRKEKTELLSGLTVGTDSQQPIVPLKQETLILWGEHDQIFLLEKAYELQKLLGKHVRLQIMENMSHLPQLENPNEFNKILKKFFLATSNGVVWCI